MAETDLFRVSTELLSSIASPAFGMHMVTRKQLDKLMDTLEKIQAVLPDAEKKKQSLPAVQKWIERVSHILDKVERLLQEHGVDDAMLEQDPTMLDKQLKEVLFHFSKLNPCGPNQSSVSNKVKVITNRLLELCDDIEGLNLVKCHFEQPTVGLARVVVGRQNDKNSILDLLFDDSKHVIVIAGVGGMGKTTLAQLVYNHDEVPTKFKKCWWACVSFIGHRKEALGKIYQTISNGQSYHRYNTHQLQSKITKVLTSSGKYLLVLDGVWDNVRGFWSDIMPLLDTGAKGSKVIVTTRFKSLSVFMHKDNCCIFKLNGLSEQESWELFQKSAFPDGGNDRNIRLGREIVNKCANVPSAIKSIASLLSTKNNLQEWEGIVKNEKLPCDSYIMSTLKLSYDRLSKNLRNCLDYCALFPTDDIVLKDKLIYLWIAQGFVKLENYETLEEAGYAYFKELYRRGFFHGEKVDDNGDIISCKVHDIVRDLVKHVAIVRSKMLSVLGDDIPKKIRHVSVGYEIDDSSRVPQGLLDRAKKLQSLLVVSGKSCSSSVLGQELPKFKALRALDLHALGIQKVVPSSIKELINLRYLNLSQNEFSCLPDSIKMLVNLLSLDISYCRHLEALPNELRKLTKLRHLDISYCDNLWHMPPGFGELTSLVHLSDFKVSKLSGDNKSSSKLDELHGLDLKGKLAISFDYKGAWRRDEPLLKTNHIPPTLQLVTISDYPSVEMPLWWKETVDNSVISSLGHLVLIRCKQVKKLPPLCCLPNLKILQMYHLQELEYVQQEFKNKVPSTKGFPCLQKLELVDLPKLKQWSRAEPNAGEIVEEQQLSLSNLSHLTVKCCHRLKSMPTSSHLQVVCLEETSKELVQQLVSASSSSFTLQDITINWCIDLTSFEGEALTALRKLDIRNCTSLKTFKLAPSSALEEITISSCPDLDLWDKQRGVNWSSYTKLRLLSLDKFPSVETLPDCLQQLTALGKLHINEW